MAAVGGAYFHYIAYSETFKILLLHNASMDFIIIWYECSLGEPLLDSWRNFNPTKNMTTVGGAYFHYTTYSAKLEKNLLHNGFMDFIIIWHDYSLGGPHLDSLNKFWSDKKHDRRGRAYFHYMTW